MKNYRKYLLNVLYYLYKYIFKFKSIDFDRLNMIHTPALNCKLCIENQRMNVVTTFFIPCC